MSHDDVRPLRTRPLRPARMKVEPASVIGWSFAILVIVSILCLTALVISGTWKVIA